MALKIINNEFCKKSNKKFWVHNTAFYVDDFKENDEYFIYYFLQTLDFKQFNAGSAVPTLNRNHIHSVPIIIPPLFEQRAIAEVLSSLDDKIDLLNRQNKTLEQMAETLFKQWFIEEAKEEWEEKPLSSTATFLNGLACQKFPPSKQEIEKKDKIFKPMIDKIIFNNKQLISLVNLRDILLPKLMCGKIRLKL